MLHKADPMLTLVMHCDTLCEACPHNAGGICESAEKVHRYDAQVLALCGLTDGARLHWSAFRQAVKTQILRAGKFAEVCAGCQWETICTAACAKESV